MDALLVSDDAHLMTQISTKLEQLGHRVCCISGPCVAQASMGEDVDLVLCDLGEDESPSLALLDGLEHVWLPKIAIGATTDPGQVVNVLRSGADDYMSRPLSLAELVARMEALLRRAQVYSSDAGQQGRTVRLDPTARELQIGRRRIALTPTEFNLLRSLAQRPGEAVPRDDLIRQVWGASAQANGRLNLYIWSLRQKIEDDPNHPRWIVTRRGKGYCFRVPSHRDT